jgi:hypothetical protein
MQQQTHVKTPERKERSIILQVADTDRHLHQTKNGIIKYPDE